MFEKHNEQLTSARGTKDVDLAITISDEGQDNQVKAALIETGLFEADKTEAIKLMYKNSIEVICSSSRLCFWGASG